jgi:ferredoxin
MRLTVDVEKCQGHARCFMLCPELFQLDDLGFALPQDRREVPVEFERAAQRAADNCPEHAITVEE